MKKILLLLIIGGIVYAALSYHFILTDNSIKVLKKTNLTFDNTYVDARGRKQAELYMNPALLKAGIRNIFKADGVTIQK